MTPDMLEKLQQMSLGGWDGIDDPKGVLKAAGDEAARVEREERMRQARIIHDCFATEAGQRCLALLRSKTIDRPPTAEELTAADPAAFALGQARRMGSANLVFMIEAAIATAKGLEKKEPTDVT